MKAALLALAGMAVGTGSLAAYGFVLGGFTRMAPCREAGCFTDGAVFGAMVHVYLFGIPAVVIGGVGGLAIAYWANRRFSISDLLWLTVAVALATTVIIAVSDWLWLG